MKSTIFKMKKKWFYSVTIICLWEKLLFLVTFCWVAGGNFFVKSCFRIRYNTDPDPVSLLGSNRLRVQKAVFPKMGKCIAKHLLVLLSFDPHPPCGSGPPEPEAFHNMDSDPPCGSGPKSHTPVIRIRIHNSASLPLIVFVLCICTV